MDGLVGGGLFVGVAFEQTLFEVLLGVVESAAGVAHENRAGNGDDSGTNQDAADEFDAKQEAANDWDKHGQERRHEHLAQSFFRCEANHVVVIGRFFAVDDFWRHHLVTVVSHFLGGFDGVVGEHGREVFDEGATDDSTSHDGELSDVQNRLKSDGGVVADVGDNQGHGGQSGGADSETFADGGGSVADSVELVGDFAHVMREVARFGDAAGVVGDGTKGINTDGGTNEGQHTHSGHGDAIHAGDFAGDENGDANHQNWQKYRAGADGVTFGDDESGTLGGDFCEFTRGAEVGRSVVFGDGADADATGDAQDGRNQRGSPAQHELRIEIFAGEQNQADNRCQDGGAAGREVSGVVEFFTRVFAHLVQGNIQDAQQAREQAAARDENRGQDGRAKQSFGGARIGAEDDNGYHHSGNHGRDEAFQQIGAVASDVVDVVADEVGDNVRHARVVFGQVAANFRQDVRRDVGGFGVVTTGDTIEHGDDGAAEGVGGQAHDERVDAETQDEAGAFFCDVNTAENQVQYRDECQAKEAKGVDGESGDAAASQSNFDGFGDGHGLASAVGRADVGVGGTNHAKDANDARHSGANEEGDAASFLDE